MAEAGSAGGRRIDLAHVADFDLGRARVRPALLEIGGDDWTASVEPRVMQMLVALHRAAGAPVSRDDLITDCWGGLAISDDAVTQCVAKLRRALSGVAGAAVISVPRVGYRLVAGDAAGESRGRARAAALRWSGRVAASLIMIAGMASLAFDSRSAAGAGAAARAVAAASASTPARSEADRLHAAAVRIFRERTRPGYEEADKLLRRSVSIDPQHAPSWARLAMVVYAPWWWAAEDDPGARARLRSEALGYARRALAIDPNLAEAHQAMGFVLWDGRGLGALEYAAGLDPNNSEIRQQLADLLEERLELRKALTESLRGVELEPTNARGIDTAAHLLDRLGHRSQADALIAQLERVTHRAGDARNSRSGLRFAKGQLAEAAAMCSQSLALGDEDRWWAQSCLLDVATALHDRALRNRMLQLQPKLRDTIAYEDAEYAAQLARTRPNDWWNDLFVGGLARQLVSTGQDNLLLMLYDNRYRDVGDFWASDGDRADMLAPSLVLAMRRAGRAAEAKELRDRFAGDIAKMQAEGDTYLRLPVWRAQLAALDGQPEVAARWLAVAVAAGWKGHAPYRLAFAPDRDPVFALVREDRRMRPAIVAFQASVAAEAEKLRDLQLTNMAWAKPSPPHHG